MNKQKRMLLLLPVLGIAAWLALFGDKSPSDSVAEPVAVAPADSAPVQTAAEAEPEQSADESEEVIRLSSREPMRQALMSPAADVDLFASKQQVQAEESAGEQVVEVPPPPPQPSFSFIGKKYDNGRWTVFLETESQALAANQGAVIDGFRIDAIRDNEIQLTHVDTKSKHIIPTVGGNQ